MVSIESILAQNVTLVKSSIPRDLLEYFEPAECGKCYVCSIVAVMRECRRVLKDDGVLWINLGDSYATTQAGSTGTHSTLTATGKHPAQEESFKIAGSFDKLRASGLKPKDLCGIPWRVAFALQDDGWYLRQDIIWHKPNPMPESVTDRCTKAHEYVFLLTKRERYYYDAEAIKETSETVQGPRPFGGAGNGKQNLDRRDYMYQGDNGTRNRRSVWTVATSPYSGAHFATFPPALIEPMILAGTSARGECPHCGKAWVRVVEKTTLRDAVSIAGNERHGNKSDSGYRRGIPSLGNNHNDMPQSGSSTTLGWRQQCACPPHEPIPQTILDPFAGSGTTGAVAVKHGRRAVLLDLNTKYIDLQFERTNGVQITMPV